MASSDRSIIWLLIAGVVFAVVRLGDELIRVVDEVKWFLGGIVRGGSRVTAETDITLETIVLALLAIFLVVAILDYVSSEW